jgi:hypothetical protein
MASMTVRCGARETLPRVTISRRAWTTDRWGRLLGGGSIAVCLAASFLRLDPLTPVILAECIAVWLAVSALIGWCPIHEVLKRLGIPDREEVWARTQRTADGTMRIAATEDAPVP